MLVLSFSIELGQSKFPTKTSSKAWALNKIPILKTSPSMLRICSTWQMMWICSIQMEMKARVKEKRPIIWTTHKTSKQTTSWAMEENNKRSQCSLDQEVTLHHSQEADVNFQTRKVKYNLCHSRATDLERHLKIWMACWAQTILKINRTDPWVHSLRPTTIN